VRPDSPPPASLAEPLLTCHEAAELLAVKPAWIYAAARSGKLTCVRVGRNVRLLRSDLEQFVAQQRSTTPRKSADEPEPKPVGRASQAAPRRRGAGAGSSRA
jgi:excisionase family DNA binding protein